MAIPASISFYVVTTIMATILVYPLTTIKTAHKQSAHEKSTYKLGTDKLDTYKRSAGQRLT